MRVNERVSNHTIWESTMYRSCYTNLALFLSMKNNAIPQSLATEAHEILVTFGPP